MINAILKNKVDRNYFKQNEDSLTALIFEKLNYLPFEIFEYIIKKSVLGDLPNVDFSTIEEIIYWPHWNSENTNNNNYVEPDLLIRLAKYDILIEAKRYDSNQQYSSQWRNEIIAYHNEYGNNKELIFIGLGGINSYKNEQLLINENKITIYKCKWISILKNTELIKEKLELSSSFFNPIPPTINILNDLIIVFRLYGYSSSFWFEKFNYEQGITETSLKSLINNKRHE